MYLVTGGAGFIGSNIVAGLAGQGEDVVICDWLGHDERWRNLNKHKIFDIIMPDDLQKWLVKRRLKAVVHMGAISATTERDVNLICQNNIRLTLDLWDWCCTSQTPFIYASSAATYGDGKDGFDDNPALIDKLLPLNAYGWSKNMIDRAILRRISRGESSPPQWAALKFFNVFGPNEYHKGSMRSVIARDFSAVRDGAPMHLFRSYLPAYADGGQMRDFIYVRDCVDVVLWLLANVQVSGIFNVGTGKARSWSDLAIALFSALSKPTNIEFVEMPPELRDRYQYFTQAHMNRLRTAGYNKDFTTLEAGVADYVNNYLLLDDPYR